MDRLPVKSEVITFSSPYSQNNPFHAIRNRVLMGMMLLTVTPGVSKEDLPKHTNLIKDLLNG